MEFEVYRAVFCVLVGISWGIVFFAVRLFTGNVGMIASFADRNDDGDVKFFTFWNLGLVSALTIAGLVWLSLQENSFVAGIIEDSWIYFFHGSY